MYTRSDGPRRWAHREFYCCHACILVTYYQPQVEFDSPKELLKIKDGRLRELVDESGDRETLYAMAGAH